jgi:hypothetical protein
MILLGDFNAPNYDYPKGTQHNEPVSNSAFLDLFFSNNKDLSASI